MLRSSFLRAVPLLALLVPVTFACTPVVHEVGSDDAGDAEKKPTDICSGLIESVCGSAFYPSNCTLGPSSCVDGFVKCGQLTCVSADAGACTLSAAMDVCHPPALGPGCTVGPNKCVGDTIECGQVTCPEGDAGPPPVDGGTDSGDGCDPASTFACGLGDYPPNCFVDRVCNDGEWSCGPVQCPDAGPDASDLHHNCGTIDCDVGTQYCEVSPRCIGPADAGPGAGYACKPIPGACENADTCPCIVDGLNVGPVQGHTGVVDNGACVVTDNCV